MCGERASEEAREREREKQKDAAIEVDVDISLGGSRVLVRRAFGCYRDIVGLYGASHDAS